MATSNHFQYLLRQVDYDGTQKNLQREQVGLESLGNDGWELAAVVPVVEEGTTVRIVFCLKKHTVSFI